MKKKLLPLAAACGVAVVVAVGAVTLSSDDGAGPVGERGVLGASYEAGSVRFGVSDDTGKYSDDGGESFFATMKDVGLTENRITVLWDPARPDTIVEKPFLDRSVPKAAAAGIRLVFAVYPLKARAIGDAPASAEQFASFLQLLATTYPQVKDYIVGNEPNQPRFWQPQFNADCSGASAAAYVALLARSYDTLKSIDPSIRVISSLSPRGNDSCRAQDNVSTSPVRFVRDMGLAYRASGRTKPLFDEFGFHPYPNSATDALDKGYNWPNAGVANLDRIKQAIWDAFEGTGQPTVQQGLKLRLAEIGWQVGIVPSAAGAYTGAENIKPTDEARQAQIYADLVKKLSCDPAVSEVLFFGLIDEPSLAGFQAALMRADGSKRPSYDAVKEAIAQTSGRCTGTPVQWSPSKSVIGASVDFPSASGPRSLKQRSWGFSATADEDANYKAAIFRLAGRAANAGASARSLASASAPSAVLSTSGLIEAKHAPFVRFPGKTLPVGSYVYGISMSAAMNSKRTKVFVSKPFRVGTPAAAKPKPKAKAKPAPKKKPSAKKKK